MICQKQREEEKWLKDFEEKFYYLKTFRSGVPLAAGSGLAFITLGVAGFLGLIFMVVFC